MKHPARLLTLLFSVLVLTAMVGPAVARRADHEGRPEQGSSGKLQMYTATVNAKQLEELRQGGYDIASIENTVNGLEVDLVLYKEERDALLARGLDVLVTRNEDGLTSTQAAFEQAALADPVFRPWDGPGNIEEELLALDDDPKEKDVAVYDIGDTHEGRDILAVRLTNNAKKEKLGKRPAVLYQGTIHAREWIAAEVVRREMHWFIDHKGDKDIKKLLDHTELWFVPVQNPDGYQYTFTPDNRLWRKNLRNNDGFPGTSSLDGVDPNRNYPEHWNYDEEGSSNQLSSQTYRGPDDGSEPEIQANMAQFETTDFKFAISYHSFGNLLLYPQGWQVQTPSADDPIYLALAGTDDNPAIPGYNPGVGGDLYITNGEFTDWAHSQAGVPAFTIELPEGCEGCGFEFPDDEALIQAEFENNLAFARNVAMSAEDPDDPVSHSGMDTQDLYLDLTEIDPWKNGNPASDLTVETSYAGGSSQWVEVLAKRQDKDVKLTYVINGGKKKKIKTTESAQGERFGGNNAYDVYYHYVGGSIPGLAMGDSVEYWFTEDKHGKSSTEHVTFDVVGDATKDVLILAAEDRTGASTSPPYAHTDAATPNYLGSYEAALTDAGYSYEVYDVDAMGRQAPDDLGVLSHYDAIVWYTGNDFVTREPGWGPGNASRLANDLMLAVRAYLNQGGRLLYTGQLAGALENGLAGTQLYDPVANERCNGPLVDPAVTARCLVISDKNDFLQYYLGDYIYIADGGTGGSGPFPVDGVSDPYDGTGWTLNGPDSADNQESTASFITTSSILKPASYSQFTSHAPAIWETGVGGAYEPHSESMYAYSDRADISYKRLTRTISVPGAGTTDMSFFVSYDTEIDWDYVFVEAHPASGPDIDDWDTLPDLNGNTHTGPDSTGESCPAGWVEDLHPHLAHYQTFVPADPDDPDSVDTCLPTGSSGTWNAATGNSAGWQEWQVDLTPYAGKDVEVSISYVSDWATQGLGTWVDDITLTNSADGELPGTTDFETDDGGWTIPGPPPGSDPNPNDFTITTSVGFEEGAVVSTEDTLYFGFGFEGITDPDERADVMGRSIGYLIP
jgi:hypothetical protein